ncbi:GntR family transcriptional regulator [Streptomyces sp. NPDC008125]|uniref:GntR family transcriptional regulator n=1 Tax=Streptomyces sp. NPDC008125 TaxID=3364811 RepID=UPI0036F13958
MEERLADVIASDDLAVGANFPSTAELSARFGVSRPTVTKALGKLEFAGLLSRARQGKQCTVRAPPKRTESPESGAAPVRRPDVQVSPPPARLRLSRSGPSGRPAGRRSVAPARCRVRRRRRTS